MGLNTFTISGRLTRDPELKTTKNGTSVLKFGLAHNERQKVEEEWIDVPHFFDCQVWAGYAEMLAQKLQKGDEVAISGNLAYSSWENQEGEKRSKVELVVRQLVGEAVYRKSEQLVMAGGPEGEVEPPDDDGIPF